MLIGVKDECQTDLASNNVTIKNSKKEKVVGIIFDNKLDFPMHLPSITKKGEYNLQCPFQSTKIHDSIAKDILNILF